MTPTGTMNSHVGDAQVIMKDIDKRFGSVQALDKVNFTLYAGEVHAILGENGAGKTTLMNVLSGLYRADQGEIFINGSTANIAKPKDAVANGIGMVHQHFELIPNFTALENIILGKEGSKAVIDMDAQRKRVLGLMEIHGLFVDLDTKVKRLAVGIQQKIEILKVLYQGVATLILDEPSTMLTPQEVETLFKTIRSMTAKRISVVLITHKIKEVLSVSDRITVMRRGKIVRTVRASEIGEQELVELMMGEKKGDFASVETAIADTRPLIEGYSLITENLGVQDEKGQWSARNVSIQVKPGEVVGIVGVSGNGQRELAEAVLGLRQCREGKVIIRGQDLTKASIKERMACGVALIPEDRLVQGILPDQSLMMSFILGPHHFLFGTSLLFDIEKSNSITRDAIKEYQILAPSERADTRLLSGGNIQKLIVARAFLLYRLVGSTLLIAFNPTRGLDYMSSQFIHKKLIELKETGKSVLLVSEDLDETFFLCNRLYVFHKGRVVGEFSKDSYDLYEIGALMVGLDKDPGKGAPTTSTNDE